EGLADGALGGRVIIEKHRPRFDRYELAGCFGTRRPAALDDRFERNPLIGHALGNRSESARAIMDGKADVVAAFMGADAGLPIGLEAGSRAAESAHPVATGNIGNVAHDRR